MAQVREDDEASFHTKMALLTYYLLDLDFVQPGRQGGWTEGTVCMYMGGNGCVVCAHVCALCARVPARVCLHECVDVCDAARSGTTVRLHVRCALVLL